MNNIYPLTSGFCEGYFEKNLLHIISQTVGYKQSYKIKPSNKTHACMHKCITKLTKYKF